MPMFTPEQIHTLLHAVLYQQHASRFTAFTVSADVALVSAVALLQDQRSTRAKPASFAAHGKMYEEVSKALTMSHLYCISIIGVLRECGMLRITIFLPYLVLSLYSLVFCTFCLLAWICQLSSPQNLSKKSDFWKDREIVKHIL